MPRLRHVRSRHAPRDWPAGSAHSLEVFWSDRLGSALCRGPAALSMLRPLQVPANRLALLLRLRWGLFRGRGGAGPGATHTRDRRSQGLHPSPDEKGSSILRKRVRQGNAGRVEVLVRSPEHEQLLFRGGVVPGHPVHRPGAAPAMLRLWSPLSTSRQPPARSVACTRSPTAAATEAALRVVGREPAGQEQVALMLCHC